MPGINKLYLFSSLVDAMQDVSVQGNQTVPGSVQHFSKILATFITP